MPWATHAGSGRLTGSLLPLDAYRRVRREPATLLKKAAATDEKKRASVVWETVSSWEGSEGTGSGSAVSGASGASSDKPGDCRGHLQTRMERLRRLNPFRRGPSVRGAAAPSAAAAAAATKTSGAGTSVGGTRARRAGVSRVDADRDGQGTVLSSHVFATAPPQVPQTLHAVGARPRERRCRVRCLAPAEWSALLQLSGAGEGVEL
ncbi:uncharacterized protein Tco025E_02866 [Trypanosoma conorhini]|uniref:Uncharacterized protein n=1 Tax=Trypanosoma conorhini TaxID=83891 RepID=A0A422PZL1_9TRYP|nr:uncharacterized protein Tco025E_02866 [Trypanosoma conorhini]RNF23172.1 hypothetical protein Tco025E_02866 [Trypanosoma conorhini]